MIGTLTILPHARPRMWSGRCSPFCASFPTADGWASLNAFVTTRSPSNTPCKAISGARSRAFARKAIAAAAAAAVEKPKAPWPVAAALEQAPAQSPATPSPAAKTPGKPAKAKASPKQPYCAHLTDVEKDRKHVESLYQALVEAKKNAGEKLGDAANFDSFSSFVKKKTDQIRKQYACNTVEYSVELEAGKVRLKAKAGSKA